MLGIKFVFSDLIFPHSFKAVLVVSALRYSEPHLQKVFYLHVTLNSLWRNLFSQIRGVSKYKFLWGSDAGRLIQIKT